jgi:hypothetical protein
MYRQTTQIGVDTNNWWPIYKWFFLFGGVGKLYIFEECQIQRPIEQLIIFYLLSFFICLLFFLKNKNLTYVTSVAGRPPQWMID